MSVRYSRMANLAWILAVAQFGQHASAQTPSRSWHRHEDALARIVVVESDARPADAAAILHTLRNRRLRGGLSIRAVLRYSAPTHAPRTARTAEILDWRPREMSSGRRRQYQRARRYVREWLAGALPSPCSRPTYHWRGPNDPRRRWFRPVQCTGTLNMFGVER